MNETWFTSLSPAEQSIVLSAARLALQDGNMIDELNINPTVAYNLVESMDSQQIGQLQS